MDMYLMPVEALKDLDATEETSLCNPNTSGKAILCHEPDILCQRSPACGASLYHGSYGHIKTLESP
jgi:hypothetical protein